MEVTKVVKAKTLQKQKKSLENTSKFKIKDTEFVMPINATERLLDENFIGRAIIECLKNNDPQGVIEILTTYINTAQALQTAQEVDLPKSTFYHTLKSKNPTLKTLAKLVYVSTLAAKR